jgi:branched-chain amino acid transport system substrate-binding protein
MPYLHADAMTTSTQLVAENPKFKNVFQFCPSDVSYGRDIAANMFDIPAKIGWEAPNKKIAVIRADYSYNIAASDLFIKLAEEKGYEIVVNEIVQFGTVEWGPVLSKIKETQPSYVTFWVLDPTDASRFTMQFVDKFQEEGISALMVMQYTPMYPEYLEITGDKANGVIFSTNVMPIGKGVKEFNEKFSKQFGEEPKSTYANITYDAFQIWVNAVEKTGCYDCYDKVEQAIRETKYDGMGGFYEFTTDDQQAKSGDDFIPSLWYQVQAMKRAVTFPEKYQEAEYVLPPWIKK